MVLEHSVAESTYPLNFRHEDAKALGNYLQQRQSVELVGMKRVGINNFLRFFLFKKDIKETYLPKDGKSLFILVDLNDLIERELFSFWRLTLKRIVDAVEESELDNVLKEKVSSIFLRSIQSGDFFLTYDGVKEILSFLAKQSIEPTIFFTRFDRIKEAVSLEFFDNLQSLKDAAQHKLAYVFTSFRELSQIAPNVFDRKSLSVFSAVHAIKPALIEDAKIIMQTLLHRYQMTIGPEVADELLMLSGGHVQYLQLSLIILKELSKGELPVHEVKKKIIADERISLLSEELWESLSVDEQEILKKIETKKGIHPEEKENGRYIWEMGFVTKNDMIFSPLFAEYVATQEAGQIGNGIELSKKEHALFSLLEKNLHDICERETIVEVVWPEYKEYGVSDWSIDRLVARVRGKLKKQKNSYEIITVRTRGYKLVTAS